MIMAAFVFNIVCQMIPCINKNALNLFAISNLFVVIEFDSIKVNKGKFLYRAVSIP